MVLCSIFSNIPGRIEDLTPLSETREDQISSTESVAIEDKEREELIEQILSGRNCSYVAMVT